MLNTGLPAPAVLLQVKVMIDCLPLQPSIIEVEKFKTKEPPTTDNLPGLSPAVSFHDGPLDWHTEVLEYLHAALPVNGPHMLRV